MTIRSKVQLRSSWRQSLQPLDFQLFYPATAGFRFTVLPLFFFSSALFPVPDLPGAMRVAVQLNPLSYGVDGLRGALSGGFAFGAATDFAVLSLLAAILLPLGAWLFSNIEV